MPTQDYCIYHIGASIGGLPAEIEVVEVYTIRYIPGQPGTFELLSDTDYAQHSFGSGHLRVVMTMSEDFPAEAVLLFQFIVTNPDTGINATILTQHVYGNLWEKAKLK